MDAPTIPDEPDEGRVPIGRLMSPDVWTTLAETTVAEAAARMRRAGVGCLVIQDAASGGVAGLFTERDLLTRVVGAGRDPAGTTIGDVMTSEVEVLDADTPYAAALALVTRRGFRHVPVVSEGKLVGIVSMRDLLRIRLRSLEAQHEEEVRALHDTRALLALDETSRTHALLSINRRLRELALTDELTGLYNQRYFLTRLAQEVVRSHRLGAPLAVILSDIDHFKRINDAHGHPEGDRVLQHVARCLRDVVAGPSILVRLRKSDVVTRYGGEEFAVLLLDARLQGARIVAERIRAGLAASAVVLSSGATVRVTVSLGVASYPESATETDTLIRAADEALYRAKAGGRDRVAVAPPRKSAGSPPRSLTAPGPPPVPA